MSTQIPEMYVGEALRSFYNNLSLKCKISAIWLVEKECIFLIFLIATVQISMKCEKQESKTGLKKHLNLYWPKTHKCSCRVNQKFYIYAILNLHSVSMYKILATEFITVKVSETLHLK